MAGFLEKVTRLSRHRNLQAIRKVSNKFIHSFELQIHLVFCSSVLTL